MRTLFITQPGQAIQALIVLTPCVVATSDSSFSAGMPLPLSETDNR